MEVTATGDITDLRTETDVQEDKREKHIALIEVMETKRLLDNEDFRAFAGRLLTKLGVLDGSYLGSAHDMVFNEGKRQAAMVLVGELERGEENAFHNIMLDYGETQDERYGRVLHDDTGESEPRKRTRRGKRGRGKGRNTDRGTPSAGTK